MRDIRDDLKERLGALVERQEALKKELSSLEEEGAALARLYEVENLRYHQGSTGTPGSAATQLHGFGFRRIRPIADFIDDLLDTGPKTKDQLREQAEAAGYFKGEEAAGRVLHATLMNLDRHGRIVQRPDGKYEKAPNREVQGRLTS